MTSPSDPTEIRKLPIRLAGSAIDKMVVYCPRRQSDIDLDTCTACPQCIGLSLRDSYLVCGWEPQQDAPLAPPTQPLRRAPAPRARPLSRFERVVITADLDESVLEAACRMRDNKVGCVVVTQDQRPVGIVTDRDLVLRVVAERLDPATTAMSSVVTFDTATIRRSEGIETAARTMRAHGVRRLPIVDEDGRIAGIVTADDLIRLLGAEIAALGDAVVDGSESR